ncbi:hypothetical protein TrRE_jg4581 [Triparma retinervis]|uniref:Bms1-type G domain-containing protein n=1 Tax=Triparma retinervis TaxID=2557542 RepID=A0A9W6ZXF8_9STRA|nr:hypothetical protein TrRE_jg4581 [Triparma retinervis]
MPSSHRSGGLKQSNKGHKTGGSSKRSQKRQQGGKVNKSVKKNAASAIESKGRVNRQNEAKQRRQNARQATISARRIGSLSTTTSNTTSSANSSSPPKIVGVVSLSEPRVGPDGAVARVSESQVKAFIESSPDTSSVASDPTITTFPQLKGQVQLLTPSQFGADESSFSCPNYIPAILELSRVCDVLLFVIDGVSALAPPVHAATSATTSGDESYPNLLSVLGERTLTAIKAQGLPTVLSLLVLPPGCSTNQNVSKKNGGMTKGERRKIEDLRKYTSRFLKGEVGYDVKVVEDDCSPPPPSPPTSTNNNKVLPPPTPLSRALVSTAPSPIHFVSSNPRNYVVSSSYSYDSNSQTLTVEGFVRGNGALSANDLVHIPQGGTFKLASVTSVSKARKNAPPPVPVTSDPSSQQPLDMFASPDMLDGEQNLVGFDGDDQLSDYEDMEDATPAAARPAGWSDYQNAWLEDADQDELDSVGDGDDFDHGELSDMFNKKSDRSQDDLDMDEADGMISSAERAELAKRRRAAEEELEFPDEVQCDEDEEASKRFARYRALKSFRKSTWDPKENLPEDYSTLFHFSNFKATARSVLAEAKEVADELVKVDKKNAAAPIEKGDAMDVGEEDEEEDDDADEFTQSLKFCVQPNRRVVLTIADVTPTQFNVLGTKRVITLTTLLPHENKMSVLHFNICQNLKCETDDDLGKEAPVKSKDVLTFQVGFRSWQSRPIFSQNNLNSDKHKFERFLRPQAFMACSAYGPVTYGPCPVLVWREPRPGQSQRQLVAVGSVLGADADRIVVKRVILTGYPVRVHKRTATVKYMFYNPDDVKWFKPAGLTTKHGLQGNIVESIGTHGAMKCLFNQPIKQHDTVCLTLWKRIYPKYEEEMEKEEKRTFVVT